MLIIRILFKFVTKLINFFKQQRIYMYKQHLYNEKEKRTLRNQNSF